MGVNSPMIVVLDINIDHPRIVIPFVVEIESSCFMNWRKI
jgi:hypothetical protein